MGKWDEEFQKVLAETLVQKGTGYTTSAIPSTAKNAMGIYTGSSSSRVHGGGGGSLGVTGSAGSYMQNKANARSGVSAPLVSSRVISRMTTGKKKKDEEDERKWFQKGLFADGYDFGDISRTILGTTTDTLENLGSGIIGIGEKTVDALAYIAPFAENAQFYQNGGFNLETEKVHKEMVEQSKKDLGKFIAKDLYDEEKVARTLISNPARKIGIDSESHSVFGEKSDALIQSGGQLLATAGLSAAGLPWWATTGVTSFGSEAENAMNQGATYEEAGASATISAGAEILSEKLSGGISFGGKTLDDALVKRISSGISNKVGRTFAKLGMDMTGEGIEEVFSQIASNLGSSLYKEENLQELLFSEEAFDEYLESFIGGAVLGGVSGGVNAIKEHNANKLNEIEQPVVKNEVTGETLVDSIDEQPEVVVTENETITEVKPKRVLYTGSANTDIKQFKVGAGSKQTGDRYGRGIYLTTNENTAKNYAGENGRVYQTSVDDLNIFNLNDTITPEMKESLVSGLRDTDTQYRNSVLRNFRSEQVFEDFESAEEFFEQQQTVWKEQDGMYDANKPVIKSADHKTGKAVIEYTDFANWENAIGDLTGSQLYDALKSLSTDDFSSFITANGFDGISFDEDADNQQYVIYRNEDRIKIDEPTVEDSTVSETKTVAPLAESSVVDAVDEPITLEALESERQSLEDTLHSLVAAEDFGDQFKDLSAIWSEVNKKIEAIEQAQNPKQETEKPLTTAEKAQKHYRDKLIDFDNLFEEDNGKNRAKYDAIVKATEQAQNLISNGADGVKSITEIFGQVSVDGKLEDFEKYVYHLLNVDRSTLKERFDIDNKYVFGEEVTAEMSQKEVDRLESEHPEFKKVLEDVYAFNNHLLDMQVQGGVITQEFADMLSERYPHYAPISRSRWGDKQISATLLDFINANTSADADVDELGDFIGTVEENAPMQSITSNGYDFNPLIDTMVDRALRTYWTVALNGAEVDPGFTAPVSETVTEDTQTNVEPEILTIEVEESASDPSPQRREDLMDNSMSIKKVTDEYLLDNGYVFEKIDRKIGSRNLEAYWHHIRNASSIAQHIIGNGVNGSRSLNDIVDEAESSGLTSEFYSYMGHQRNIDGMTMQARYGVAANRNFMGRDITAARSMAEVRKLESEHPEFKQWAQDCYTYTDSILKQYVEHGVISRDDFVLLKELYPHYVPMRTEKGAVKPMFETLAQFTIEAQNAMAFNDFGVELENTLHTEVGRDLMNIDSFIGRIDSGDNLFTFGENGDFHTLTVYQNGELKTFDITKEMYMAMKPSASWLNWKIPVLSQASEFFRKSTTEYNLWFAMKNGVRDPQDIIYNSQHPAQTYANLAESVKQITTKGEYYQEYLANGGEDAVYYNPKNKTFDPQKGVTDYLKKITGLEAVSTVNNRIETIPRLAEYIASREAGASLQEAMLDSARVTTNFAAGGKFTKFLNRNGCTFLNASVQGALQHHRNIQEAKVNGLKAVASLAARYVATGLTASMLNKLIWDDDEDYQNLPDYISNNYYIVGKYGDGQFVRIPKGRTNVVIENAIKQVAKQSNGNDQADWNQFWDLFIENMAPNNPATDNIFAPIIEVATNTSWYGEDIIPYRLKDLPASEQFDEKTDSLSVWLGEKLDYSPKKINYLINSYTGVIGDTLLPLGTPKAESPSDSFLGKVTAPLRDIFTTDSVLNNRVTGDFYETLEAAELKAESKDATPEDKFKSGLLIGYNVEISKLMQEQRDIQTSDLPDSEKYKRNRELKEQINALQEKGLEALDGYSIDGIYAESGDKRYNYSAEDDTWWEIKPKLANGEDNWYYQQEQKAHDKWGISYSKYWNNSEAYSEAVYVADHYGDSFYETAQHAIGLEKFTEIASGMADIKADKDKNGESISGSRKKKMKAYIYDLDIPDIQKHILFKAQYPYTRTHAYEIVKYLDENDDISYEAFYDILDELGYKVDSKGRVTWW